MAKGLKTLKLLKQINLILLLSGLDLKRIYVSIKNAPSYCFECIYFLLKSKNAPFCDSFSLLPVLAEKEETAGNIDIEYFYQDIYVAQQVIHDKPSLHLDIGSRLDGFCSHLIASKQNIAYADIRSISVNSEYFSIVDLRSLYDTGLRYDSISSLHVIEHIGLGRYGDDLDPLGYLKFLRNLFSILSKGGKLYLSIPTAKRSETYFNAHRKFSLVDQVEMISSTGFEFISLTTLDSKGFLRKTPIDDFATYNVLFESSLYSDSLLNIWILSK